MNDCNHKFVDSKHCLKCGWVPPRCETIDTQTDGYEIQQRPCGKPAVALVNGLEMCQGCIDEYRSGDLIETLEELPDA